MEHFIMKLIVMFNAVEGFIHLIVAFIGLYGAYKLSIYDWKILVAPIENLVFGFFSLLTAYMFKDYAHRH